MKQSLFRKLTTICKILIAMNGVLFAQADPVVVPKYQDTLSVSLPLALDGHPTQMAWGPDARLYVMTTDAGVLSFKYDKETGVLSNKKLAVTGIFGLGIGFRMNEMYLSTFDGSIHKLTDDNGNGIWGETIIGELDVKIVTGIPQGDHNTNTIQIVGDTLYVGIGRRTINGRKGKFTSGSLDDFGGSGFWSG